MRHSLIGLSGLFLAASSLSLQAHGLSYDFLDVAMVEQQSDLSEPSRDGYNLDFNYSIGSHFFLKLAFDNVSAGRQPGIGESFTDRVKSKSFGFGYRSHITESLDFVADYTKQDYKFTQLSNSGSGLITSRMNDNGDTTRIGLRGLLFDKFEWDALGVRKTIDDLDIDDTGYQVALRYRLHSDLSVGASFEDVADNQQTGIHLRYTF